MQLSLSFSEVRQGLSAMLSDQDREKIRQEEIFRDEVRKEIEARNISNAAFSTKIWRFFNSALGLWFLSTVVIGLATFTYTYAESYLSNQKAVLDKQKKLDIEVTTRLLNFDRDLKRVFDPEWDLAEYDGVGESRANFSLMALKGRTAFSPDEFTNVFPEYRDRTFRSLLIELHGLASDEDKPEIKKALDAIPKIEEKLYNFPDGKSSDDLDEMHLSARQLTLDAFGISRWPWSEYDRGG